MKKTIPIFLLTLFTAVIAVIGGCGSGAKVVTTIPSKESQPKPVINRYAFSYYVSGVLAEKEKQYPYAITLYQKALEYAPGNTDILQALAELYFGLRQPQTALETALKIHYRNEKNWFLIGNCYRILNEGEKADKAYRKVLKLNPNNLHAHWYVGNYAQQRGDNDEALDHFEEVARLNPTARIWVEIADLYNSQNKTDKTIEALRKSLEIDSTETNVESYINLSALLQGENDIAGAEGVLLDGIKKNPDDNRILWRERRGSNPRSRP